MFYIIISIIIKGLSWYYWFKDTHRYKKIFCKHIICLYRILYFYIFNIFNRTIPMSQYLYKRRSYLKINVVGHFRFDECIDFTMMGVYLCLLTVIAFW